MEHYFSEKQTSKLQLKKIPIKLKVLEFEIYSGPGVFSKDKLDRGTKLLIERSMVKGTILDLGCGIGVVGVALKKLYPKLKITMSDVNSRAVQLAKLNAKGTDIKVVKSDIFSDIKGKFDTILLNPPQAAGKEICFKMIKESHDHLKKNGFLELVARHNKGGQSYMKHMEEVFGNVKDIAKAGGYRVYLSKKVE